MFWQMADGFGMSWDIQYLITIYLGYNYILGWFWISFPVLPEVYNNI